MHRIVALIFFLLLFIPGCKEDSPVIPPLSGPNLVINGSFESNGTPTFESWTGRFEQDTSKAQYYTFSRDVPPGGGQWSFTFDNPNTSLWLSTDIPIPGPMNNYKLTLWAKSTLIFTDVNLYVSATGYNLLNGKSLEIGDSTWKEYTITLGVMDSSSYKAYPDSIRLLRVQFKCLRNPSPGGKAYFDMVRLEKIQ